MTAWKIGRLFGIDVKVHWSFLLLLAWVAYEHIAHGQTPLQAAIGVGFVLCLFGCVLLHEYGHALTARRFGVDTRDITMLPIGGVARLTSIPRDPVQELLIALAGPAVNVVIGGLIAGGLYLNGGVESLMPMDAPLQEYAEGDASKKDFIVRDAGDFFRALMIVNGFLVVFNMIPAFPMDGGRVLRAVLAMVTDYRRATRWAAGVGKLASVAFAGLYFFGEDLIGEAMPWTLLLIAVFVWYAGGRESQEVHVRELLTGAGVDRVMMTDFETVEPTDTMERVARMLLAGSQSTFPVVGVDGLPIGMLTRKGMVRCAQEQGFGAAVADGMSAIPESLPPTAPALTAHRVMRRDGLGAVPIVDGGRFVGLVTEDNLREYLMLREVFDGRDGQAMPIPESELVV